MSNESKTNWAQSVTGIVIKNNKVLLVRHTYGLGNGKLIVPGGYVNYDETPQEALKREFVEETGIEIEPQDIIGIRFNSHDWYIAFRAKYLSGIAKSDNNENNGVLWVEIEEALNREDVPDLTKKLIKSALSNNGSLEYIPYDGNTKNGIYSFYGVK